MELVTFSIWNITKIPSEKLLLNPNQIMPQTCAVFFMTLLAVKEEHIYGPQ